MFDLAVWKRELADVESTFGVRVDEAFGDSTLFQVCGVVDGWAFYLRIRHGWFSVKATPGEDAQPPFDPCVLVSCGPEEDLHAEQGPLSEHANVILAAVGLLREWLCLADGVLVFEDVLRAQEAELARWHQAHPVTLSEDLAVWEEELLR